MNICTRNTSQCDGVQNDKSTEYCIAPARIGVFASGAVIDAFRHKPDFLREFQETFAFSCIKKNC